MQQHHQNRVQQTNSRLTPWPPCHLSPLQPTGSSPSTDPATPPAHAPCTWQDTNTRTATAQHSKDIPPRKLQCSPCRPDSLTPALLPWGPKGQATMQGCLACDPGHCVKPTEPTHREPGLLPCTRHHGQQCPRSSGVICVLSHNVLAIASTQLFPRPTALSSQAQGARVRDPCLAPPPPALACQHTPIDTGCESFLAPAPLHPDTSSLCVCIPPPWPSSCHPGPLPATLPPWPWACSLQVTMSVCPVLVPRPLCVPVASQ